MKKMIIADDHAVVRCGLRAMLARVFPEFEMVETWDGASVKAELKKGGCELLLLDLIMPETDPHALIHWIKSFHPHTYILVVSMNDETVFGKRFLKLGADGYLKKDSPPEEISSAVKTVLSGEKYISSRLTNLIVKETITGTPVNPFDSLTQREFQVASYLLRDYSVAQVSELLNIHYSTASTFKQRIYEKLKVGSRKEFLDLAAAYGLKIMAD